MAAHLEKPGGSEVAELGGSQSMLTKRGKGHQISPARTEELKTQPTAPNRIICSVTKQNK